MKKKIVIGIIVVLVILAVVACFKLTTNSGKVENQESSELKTAENVATTNVKVEVYDKEGKEIYNKDVESKGEYLVDVLNELSDAQVVMEDSQYGKYITSMMGIEQGDNYYWSFYINGEYATEGVSSCKLVEDAIYSFKIEKFEN